MICSLYWMLESFSGFRKWSPPSGRCASKRRSSPTPSSVAAVAPTIYLFIDATVLPKRGKDPPQLGWHYDSRTDSVVWGQKLVISAIECGYGLVSYVPENRRLADGRYARAVETGEVACLNGMEKEIELEIVHMIRGGRHDTVVTTLTEPS
ncbi:MAG: hypothetical protein ACE5JP_16675 [Candidatus Bipolaricaulia bacterium]